MATLEPRNFLQPCLLLLLREQPDHGYELAARLRPMHDGDGDAGAVYRTLRGLERLGLVRSEWQTSDVGPARRTYYITPEGVNARACDQAEVDPSAMIGEVASSTKSSGDTGSLVIDLGFPYGECLSTELSAPHGVG